MSDKLGVNLTLVLEHIASYDEGDIESEVNELRFEDESGRDTGCDLDIREVCEEARSVIEAGFVIPPGYTLVPDDQLKDGDVAQKAFWHALEFCKEGHHIRAHWENYKAMLKEKESS